MKTFNRLREESLEEKLKASDPAGKWISDFVHSDNPKFAGKSKKERIRMALGASYAAKRQNEDNNHIVEATHRIGLTVTDPNHPMISKRKETIQKTVRMPGEDRENAIKRAIAHYRRKGYKVHDHHYMGTVDEEVELIEKYTENDIANGGTVIYKHDGKHYMSKVSHKTGGGAGTKIHTTSSLGHVVPLHNVVSTDASDWNTYKNRSVKEEVEQIDELKSSTLKTYASKAEKSYDTAKDTKTKTKRDIGLNRADSKLEKKANARNPFKEEVERIDEIGDTPAGQKALRSYINKADKTPSKHSTWNRSIGILGASARLKTEEKLDEADMMSPAETYKKLAVKHLRDSMDKSATQKQRDHAKMMNRRALEAAKMSNHTDALNHYRGMKEETNLEEGGFDIPEIPRAPTPKPAPKDKNKVVEGSAQDKLYQQHQAIRAANKRPNPEYYKELGMSYDIKDDKERIAKQAEIKKKYKVEGAQLDQLKTMRDDPKWQENPEHKAQLDKRYKMAKDRADLDKGEVVDPTGKPVPVLTPDKFKEKNPNFMKEEGEYPHQGVGVSKSMQMAADIARQKARTSLMQSKYGAEFQDKAMPDYDEDKMDLKPGSAPGTYEATVRMRERMKQESFSSFRNKIAEAKKMKGEDPCWDDYKMIGTKMKNGKEVPNCVPKEETEIEGNNIEESKTGLYANIHAKRKRIKSGSGERMRKPGTKGAPTAQAFKDSAKTAKK